MKETNIMRLEQLAASERGDRLFRNNVGTGWAGKAQIIDKQTVLTLQPGDVVVHNARPLRAGLMVGSGDLIGWHCLKIRQDMVGSQIAQFYSKEIKRIGNAPTDDQRNWDRAVTAAGGKSETTYG